MTKPIYRYLEDRKWRTTKRLITMQRVQQMSLIPDVLPHIDPDMEVSLSFGRRGIRPGDFVDSRISTIAPQLEIQPFKNLEQLVTIAVVDADVPNVEKNGFDYRCHYLASNIPISSIKTSVDLGNLDGKAEERTILSWLPPFAQRGSPYHRLGVFVFTQNNNAPLNVKAIQSNGAPQRDGFVLRSFVDKHRLTANGVHMFRCQWDEGTAGVMDQFGIPGADVAFVREKIEPLPYKKKDGARYR